MATAQPSRIGVRTPPPNPHFRYVDGTLHCEKVSFAEIAARHGTPTYVYSAGFIDEAVAAVDAALSSTPHRLAYAMKANDNLALVARMAKLGCGADIVSVGELHRARKAGIPAQHIVFSGVGKRDDEIIEAPRQGIRSLHVESSAELEVIAALAKELGVQAPVSLRVNPDVDPQTHPYISTGLHRAKFGIDLPAARKLVPEIVAHPHLRLEGLTCHIGSQLPFPEPLRESMTRMRSFAEECRAMGAALSLLDAGGGWPAPYGDEERPYPPREEYGRAILEGLGCSAERPLPYELWVEPGRTLVADAGVLLTRVIFIKERDGKRFVIVDAAMTELLRPALYGASHAFVPVTESAPEAALSPADVVGPVCETGDFLALDLPLPSLKRGDLIAIRGAGAYAAVMSSQYNARPRAAEVMVEGESERLVRRRESFEDLWRHELL